VWLNIQGFGFSGVSQRFLWNQRGNNALHQAGQCLLVSSSGAASNRFVALA